MNEKEFQNKIKTSLKNEKLQDYLIKCLKNECDLNSFLVSPAKESFDKKYFSSNPEINTVTYSRTTLSAR